MAELTDGSGSGLLLYLDKLMLDKAIDMSTGRAYRSAVRRVLGPSTEKLDKVDVRRLDLEDAWRSFRAGDSATKVGPASLPSYRTRLRKSVAMYRTWLDDGAGPQVAESGNQLIDYPFPVRAGVRATLRLPERLSSEEAARLAAFVSALAVQGDGAAPDG